MAAKLGIEKPGINQRRRNGEGDETTGRNSESDGEEDQLAGGSRDRGRMRPNDATYA